MECIFFQVFIHVEEVVGAEGGALGFLFVFGVVEGGEHEFLDGVHRTEEG